jgi:hypothetical protein
MSSRDHRSRQLLSRLEMTLEIDFAFLMCGLREGRNNVYTAKQMDCVAGNSWPVTASRLDKLRARD